MRAGRALFWLGSVFGWLGCTLNPGHGFATLVEGELAVELEGAGARDLGDGALRTDLGYRVALREAKLHVASVDLLASSGDEAAAARFDPASPPPGYRDCHGGHCHAEDGSLHSYEEIAASLNDGDEPLARVVTLPVENELDLLAGETVALDAYVPSPELPRATLARMEVVLLSFACEAVVSEGELAEPFELDVRLPLSLRKGEPLALRVDRDAPERLRPRAALRVSDRLFDGVDFAALSRAAVSGRVELDEPEGELGEAIGAGLAAGVLEAELAPASDEGHDHRAHDGH